MSEAVQKITIHTVNKKVIELEQKLDNISHVEIGDNGVKKLTPINEAVLMILDNIDVLRDANRWHKIMKKRKLYWLAAAVFIVFMGFDVKTLIMALVSKYLGL